MHRSFTAKLALSAAVGAGIGGLARSVSAAVYDRNAAVAYANTNWNKVVSDGYFWINGSTPNFYGAGKPVPVNVSGEASGIGDDCAHYVSSCLGTPAGKLTIPSRAGTYGEPGAARLDELLVGNSLGNYGTTYKYGTLVSSVSQLTPGDVIGYDWDGSGGGSMSGIDHTVIYIGNLELWRRCGHVLHSHHSPRQHHPHSAKQRLARGKFDCFQFHADAFGQNLQRWRDRQHAHRDGVGNLQRQRARL
jgi:hypothetical protein